MTQADNFHGLIEVAHCPRGVELHLKFGCDHVAEVFDDVSEDGGHDCVWVVPPDLAHVVEFAELETEGVEADDACGRKACLNEFLFLIVCPRACLSVRRLFLCPEDFHELYEVAI